MNQFNYDTDMKLKLPQRLILKLRILLKVSMSCVYCNT